MKYSSRRNKMFEENQRQKKALMQEKKKLQAELLLPRRSVTPEIVKARAKWREANPDVYPPPWEKFSMG